MLFLIRYLTRTRSYLDALGKRILTCTLNIPRYTNGIPIIIYQLNIITFWVNIYHTYLLSRWIFRCSKIFILNFNFITWNNFVNFLCRSQFIYCGRSRIRTLARFVSFAHWRSVDVSVVPNSKTQFWITLWRSNRHSNSIW